MMGAIMGGAMRRKVASQIDQNVKIAATDDKTQEVLLYLALKNFDQKKSKFSKLLEVGDRFDGKK